MGLKFIVEDVHCSALLVAFMSLPMLAREHFGMSKRLKLTILIFTLVWPILSELFWAEI